MGTSRLASAAAYGSRLKAGDDRGGDGTGFF
jgi:hypothetical protein